MKKIIYSIIAILALSVATFYGTNLVWKGWHEKGAGTTITTKIDGSKVLIGSRFGIFNSALKVSYINSQIDQEKKEIYVSLYSKFYDWPLPIILSKDEIDLAAAGTYRVFYRNPDGTNSFIREIEYK